MFNCIKKFWFWIIVDTFFALYALFLAVVFFAPHQDAQNRGFVACTQQMIQDFEACQNSKIACPIKNILKNNVCDFKVITKGFFLFFAGKQARPWSNYYFIQQKTTTQDVEDEEWRSYYQSQKELVQEMEELNNNAIALDKQLKGIKK